MEDKHSYLKAQAHGIHINLDTEDKLNQLKEQFCKWYCSNKESNEVISEETCFCCPIDEYIKFIRNEF